MDNKTIDLALFVAKQKRLWFSFQRRSNALNEIVCT